jgi:hypothetical protein
MFHRRHPGWLENPRVKVHFEGYGPFTCMVSDPDIGGSSKGDLLQRGWVLQERLLAPRMLYFDASQIRWECRCGISSEILASNLELQDVFETRDSKDAGYSTGKWTSSKDWYLNVVLPFHHLKLSYESDKLLAISGLANLFMRYNENRDDKYLAGIMESDLPDILPWRYKKKGSFRPKTYRAPSWSWASVEGEDLALRQNLEGMCSSLISAHVSLLDDSRPFGAVRAGSLVISAPFVHASWKAVPTEEDPTLVKLSIPRLDSEVLCHYDSTCGYLIYDTGNPCRYGHLLWDDEEAYCEKEIDVAIIATFDYYGPTWNTFEEVEGIVLRADGNVYHRVGYVSTWVPKKRAREFVSQLDLYKKLEII